MEWTLFFFLYLAATLFQDNQAANSRPIIGILSQESHQDTNYSYIAASYVKYIESAGARVVPILCNSTKDELTKLFGYINGALFPGGGASLNNSLYLTSGQLLYNLTLQAFSNGDYFPLWGTCLGMEMLCAIQHESNDCLSPFDSLDYSIPLNITNPVINSSRLLSFYNSTTLKWLTTEPLTMNNHRYGVDPMTFNEDWRLRSFFQVISTNMDRQGKEFVSTIEAFQEPIYGVQWHPEKNIFEWNPNEVMNHSYHAVRVAQTAANFFVEESRKNDHHFPSEEEEKNSLIYNYSPVYTSKDKDTSFEQVYLFPCC